MKNESSKMEVKRYIADDMRQGLRQIREELGADAVILSTKRIAEGVEIMTTLNYSEAEGAQRDSRVAAYSGQNIKHQAKGDARVKAIRPEPPPQEQLDSAFAQLLNQSQQAPAASDGDGELMATMRSEIEHLRLLLKEQMEQLTQQSWCVSNPVEAAVLKRFEEYGISLKVAQSIARKLSSYATIEEAWRAALSLLSERLATANEKIFKQGIVALLGPTGAGKTTTLAKLAVRYALRYGKDNLALVTTDRYRLAAYEQIKALGRILDVPVRLVDEHTSLDKVLSSLRHKPMIFIDTAGFQAGDGERRQQLVDIETSRADIKKLLVLPCTSQGQVLHAAYDLLGKSHIDACVLSKTDEMTGFGELLSLLVEKELPVAYITNGQAIPNDIELARVETLMTFLDGDNQQGDEYQYAAARAAGSYDPARASFAATMQFGS